MILVERSMLELARDEVVESGVQSIGLRLVQEVLEGSLIAMILFLGGNDKLPGFVDST